MAGRTAYVGLYLAVRPSGQRHRRRIAVVLCFVFSVVAFVAAIIHRLKEQVRIERQI